MTSGSAREFLLDVSRLVWRVWRGRAPTGIDRVCLEYARHFGPRSQAVVQYKGCIFILSPADSDRLFSIFREPAAGKRVALLAVGAKAWLSARSAPPRPGMVYLNVGHTGLDQPALPAWIASNGIRAIYLIHDLIPLTHPEFCRAGEEARHAKRMENALTSAHGVIGNSQVTLSDLSDFAKARGVDMSSSIAVWISGFGPRGAVPRRTLDRPHFVIVGTVEGRKNHYLLLQVWRRLVSAMDRDAPILLVLGQRGWEAGPAIAMLDRCSDLKDHVREFAVTDDEELAGWVAGARALLMPSFAEGFGLPVVEALQLGTPVIASDLPAFREIAGDIPNYLDPLDASAWERTIEAFVGDAAERQRQLARMPSFRAPDWTGHFETVEEWLRTL